MKLNKKKLLLIIIPAFLLICVLVIVSGYEKWQIGLTCPKCLQKASLHQIRIHGIIIYSSSRVYQNPYESKISPALYEQILGKKCDHVFKKNSFCRKKGQVYSCGINRKILSYEQRINAIEELYRVFLRCKNIDLAKETYLLIDNTLPIANDKKMIKAMELLRLKDNILKVTDFMPRGVFPSGE